MLPAPSLSVSERHCCDEDYYTLMAQTDAPYFRWSSQPHDYSLDRNEHNLSVQVTPQQSTIYTATAAYEENSKCPAVFELSLPRIAMVSASLMAVPNSPTYNQPLCLINTSTGYYSYARWQVDYDDQFHFTSEEPSLMLQPKDQADSIHVLLTIGNETCEDTAQTDILLPKATLFFPNIILLGSENNGKFFCASTGVVNFELWIYDRQGDVVYHTTDVQFTWNGTHRGKACVQAAYSYRCRYTDIYHGKHWQETSGCVLVINP